MYLKFWCYFSVLYMICGTGICHHREPDIPFRLWVAVIINIRQLIFTPISIKSLKEV